MKYTPQVRATNYLFTVTTCPAGDVLFKEISQMMVRRVLGRKMTRYGRLHDRKSVGVSRYTGAVPLNRSDRFDIYIVQPEYPLIITMEDIRKLYSDRNFRTTIENNRDIIQYANLTHKDLIERNPVPAQPQPTPVKTQKTSSTWKITLKSEIKVLGGDTYEALKKTLFSMGFGEADIVAYEKLDEHRDLPLVYFTYPKSDYPHDLIRRAIRVVKKDSEYLEGFDGDQYKKFSVDRIHSTVNLIELPAKTA